MRYETQTTKAMIFIVDSANPAQLPQLKQEIYRLMGEEDLKDIAVLVYANKQDLPEAMTVQKISDTLDLASVANGRPWFVGL
jgi:signal recognition particle receptor subunit beta